MFSRRVLYFFGIAVTVLFQANVKRKQLGVHADVNPTMGCVKKLNIPASELFSQKYSEKIVQFHLCLLRDGGYMDEKGVLNSQRIKEAVNYTNKSDKVKEKIEKCLRIERKNAGLKAVKVNQCLTPLS